MSSAPTSAGTDRDVLLLLDTGPTWHRARDLRTGTGTVTTVADGRLTVRVPARSGTVVRLEGPVV